MKSFHLFALLISLCLCFTMMGCQPDGGVTPSEVTETDSLSSSVETWTDDASHDTAPAVNADIDHMDFTFDETDTAVSSGAASQIQIDLNETSSDTADTGSPEPVTIRQGGSYTLSGTKKDTVITVDAGTEDVTLTLQGVTINNAKGPGLYVRSAGKVEIILAKGTVNTISDGASYALTDGDTTLDAALFSLSDLTIKGEGSLTVKGNYKHGIVSKDDLVLSAVNLDVTAANVGLNGKDCVKINGGTYTVRAGSDGIRSDNVEDPAKGYIYLSGGTYNITAANDGIQAQTVLNAENAVINITAGGGASNTAASEKSHKGLKAGSDILLSQNTCTLNTKDDGVRSGNALMIAGGTYTLTSGNNGMRSNVSLTLYSGTVTVNQCVEGLKSTGIAIAGGSATIHCADSGIDSKGEFTMSGGKVTIFSSAQSDQPVIEFKTTGMVTGGTLIATGGSADPLSTDLPMVCTATKAQSANTVLTLINTQGDRVLSVTPTQDYQAVLLIAPNITTGTYSLYADNGFLTDITV